MRVRNRPFSKEVAKGSSYQHPGPTEQNHSLAYLPTIATIDQDGSVVFAAI